MSTEKKLSERLYMKKKNIYDVADKETLQKIYAFSEDYKKYLDASKT